MFGSKYHDSLVCHRPEMNYRLTGMPRVETMVNFENFTRVLLNLLLFMGGIFRGWVVPEGTIMLKKLSLAPSPFQQLLSSIVLNFQFIGIPCSNSRFSKWNEWLLMLGTHISIPKNFGLRISPETTNYVYKPFFFYFWLHGRWIFSPSWHSGRTECAILFYSYLWPVE